MECSITAALCSAQAQNDLHTITVMTCLIRRLFLPANLSKGADSNRAGFEDHEKWLKDLVRTNDAMLAKGLIKALSDLVPLEPLRFLRTNHRVFSANRQHLHLFGDYLVQVRSRIGDLDPLYHAEASNQPGGIPPNGSDARRKAEADVIKFVTEFAETGGKIPPSLVRQMNFHRYHFRASTLPALLDNNLDPIGRDGTVSKMGRDSFDDHRANLIKVMAFKRKDQAVTTAEAQAALKEMKEVRQKRAAERLMDVEARPESGSKDSVLNESDNLVQMIETLFKSATRRRSTEATCSGKSLFKPSAESTLKNRLQASVKDCKDPVQLGVVASDILQGILNGLASDKDTQVDIQVDDALECYHEWWETGGIVLHAFLVDVLGQESLRKVQRPIQYHLFVLICVRNQFLTNSVVMSLAKLISVIFLLVGNASLADVCFLSWCDEGIGLTQFSNTIFNSLPLMEPANIRKSVRFAIYCVTLISALKEKEEWPGSRYSSTIVPTQDMGLSMANMNVDQSSALAPLVHLLQWALCVPWRFLKSRSSCRSNEPNATATMEAAALLKMIADVLSSRKLYPAARPHIRDLLKVEYRCGWGRSLSVKKILECFDDSGTMANELIVETSMFVAVASSDNIVSPDWIVQGVTKFAEESISFKNTIANDNNNRKGFLPRNLRKCVEQSGSSAGGCMLDILSGMSYWYFQGYNKGDADLHVGQFLIPCFWPFPNRWLKYLVNSLDRCASPSAASELNCQRNVFLISNIAMTWETIGDDLSALNQTSTFLEPLLSRAMVISRTINALTGHGVKQDQVTQAPSISNNSTCFGPEQVPIALGIAFTLFFAKKSLHFRHDAKVDAESVSIVVRQLLSSMSCVVIADVIDAAMYTAALIPFACSFAELEVQDATERDMEHVLSALLTERLRLEEAPLPAWIREKLGDSVVVEDDLRYILLQWLGKDASGDKESQSQYLRTSLAVAGCMTRMISAVLRVPGKELSLFISTRGYETITSALLPNVLTVYRTITGHESDFAKEKLSDDGMERLVSYRASAGPILMDVVTRLVSILQSLSVNNIEGLISRTLLEFPDQAEEVRLVLKTRNKLNL